MTKSADPAAASFHRAKVAGPWHDAVAADVQRRISVAIETSIAETAAQFKCTDDDVREALAMVLSA
jgi:hypothetical protein